MSDKNANDTLISCPQCNGTIDLQFFSSAKEFSCPHCSGLLALPGTSATNRQSPAPEQHQQIPFQQKKMLQGKNVFWICCGLSVLIIAVALTVVITLSVSDKPDDLHDLEYSDLPKFSSLNNYASVISDPRVEKLLERELENMRKQMTAEEFLDKASVLAPELAIAAALLPELAELGKSLGWKTGEKLTFSYEGYISYGIISVLAHAASYGSTVHEVVEEDRGIVIKTSLPSTIRRLSADQIFYITKSDSAQIVEITIDQIEVGGGSSWEQSTQKLRETIGLDEKKSPVASQSKKDLEAARSKIKLILQYCRGIDS